MQFRDTLKRALVVSAASTPGAAFITAYLVGASGYLDPPALIKTAGMIYLVGLPGVVIGLLLIGLPATNFAERAGFGQRSVVLVVNLIIAAVGFILAAASSWPFAEIKQVFWLHWGFAALIFTVVYIPGRHAPSAGRETRNA